jgi:hypothetical protein
MRWEAGHEELLDDIDGKAPEGGRESLVGIHKRTDRVAFLGKLVEGRLQDSNFIVETLQFLARLD